MTTLRSRVRWGPGIVLVWLLGGCEVEVDTDRRVEDRLRQDADIVRMWQDGVWAKSIPNLKPAQARQDLDAILASTASAKRKAEAQKLLDTLNAKPHYFALAARLGEFLPLLERCQTLAVPPGSSDTYGKVPAGKFFVFRRKPDGYGPTDPDRPGEVFFDADVLEACGDRLALAPDEVGAVVAIETAREVVGQYEVTRMSIGTMDVDLAPRGSPKKKHGYNPPERYVTGSAFQEISTVKVQAWPGGTLVGLKLLGAVDPTETVSNQRRATASEQMKTKLGDYLKQLATGTIAPPFSE